MAEELSNIHEWMYDRVHRQDELTSALVKNTLDSEKAEILFRRIDNLCGSVEKGELGEVIDRGNVHAWHENQVDIAEQRYAYAVSDLLIDGYTADELCEKVKSIGMTNPVTGENAAEIYGKVQDYVLDGMPCDDPVDIVKQNAKTVEWRFIDDIHEKYWKKADCPSEIYYKLRDSLTEGLIRTSGYEFGNDGKKRYIRKSGTDGIKVWGIFGRKK